MTDETNIWAVIPAAGSGRRMQAGVPKQYLALLGRPVLLHTLERLCSYSRLRGAVVGLAPGDEHWQSFAVPKLEKFLGVYTGGSTRAQTVLHGLEALAAHAHETDWVMVHDAVRPCVCHADLEKLVRSALDSPAGALLAIPLADTVKRAGDDGYVRETVPRVRLWRALTPQMFKLGALREALTAALEENDDITDESAAMERAGLRPRLVEGHPDNIKITHPGDLALAELFLKQQAGERA